MEGQSAFQMAAYTQHRLLPFMEIVDFYYAIVALDVRIELYNMEVA